MSVNREKGLFLSVHVDDAKLTGKKQNIDSIWKVLMKDVDLGEPTSILAHFFGGVVLNENVKQAKILWTITEICLNPKSLLELQKSYPTLRNLAQTFLHGFMIWKVMQRNAWNDIVTWRTKTTQQLHKVATPCIDDHQFKEEEMGSVGELSKVCSQIVLKSLYLARNGRPDTLRSVNKPARAITKWTEACDKR